MSLKELFAIVTAAAVFFWCAAQAGFANGTFWIMVALAVVVSVIWVGLARLRGVRLLAAVAPLPVLFFCGIMFLSSALLTQALLLFLAGLVCACLPIQSTKSLVRIAVGCFLVAFVYSAFAGRAEVARLMALRQEFPAVPLLDRLTYEHREDRPPATPVKLASSVDATLTDWEQILRDNYREYQLIRIHSQSYENFVRAAGFGIDRMPPPSRRYVRMPPLRDIAFDEIEDAPRGLDDFTYWDRRTRRTDSLAQTIHLASRDDFLHPQALGAQIGTLKQFVGFIAHAFHDPPIAALPRPEAWTIERLELVSLLKFDEPRVYVLDHLPRMDQLSGDDVPTRPLDEFEVDALKKLRTDEDVVTADEGEYVRMLGSLRAATQCLDCHAVQRGELLGAFTYVLHPENDSDPLAQDASGR